jgi:ribosome biogenesis GTPase / thiamine phosphate phosphatase
VPTLESLGWSSHFQSSFVSLELPGLVPARVIEEQRANHRVATEAGERIAVVGGRARLDADASSLWPAVGDWVAVEAPSGDGHAVIRAVLPRRSALARRDVATGGNRAQVLAANVDVVLVVTAANLDFSAARIARYVALAWEGGAQPVVVLSKADLAPEPDALREQAEAAAPGAPVVLLSALADTGMDALRAHLAPGSTAVLVGSSGAGKSTLVNRLLGEARQAVRDVNADDDRGRHTTTARHLFALPDGALVIDTPGLREVGLWDAEGGVRAAFEDIENLAASCRFRDCAHETEPGCAVLRARDDGTLDAERLESWRKLLRELAFQARKSDRALASAHRRQWIVVHKAARRRDRGRH